MLSGALGTYAAAVIVIAASTAIGAGIVAASGRREWSWAAPAVGLAAATVIAWWTVRLPGHGVTALVCVLGAAVAGAVLARRRMPALRAALGLGLIPLLGALALASIPFVVEGHFGVLGTGFNVDMSQHLFAADWLADPSGSAPGLFEQGYPLGPHALAVATGEVTGELTTAFSGVTIAIPALLALSALGACTGLGRLRAVAIALLTGFAYLSATYLAQGSFKELFEVTFLVALAIWLGELARGAAAEARRPWTAGIVPGVLAAGALYSYSGPGIAWLAGTVFVWGVFELVRRRGEPAGGILRRSVPAVFAAVLVAVVLAVPELDRITDFGGSVGTVSERADASGTETLLAATDPKPPDRGEPEFDNDLGNLFGQISPLEALNIWPSGDFRVAPGDGAVPAVVFYLGALLGAVGLAIGLAWAVRLGETALLAALAAAAAIWLAARIGSTPYTTAKALQMIAPVAMLIAARGLLDPGFLSGMRSSGGLLRASVAAAFVAGAALSSGLALANAPVGPDKYTPGVFALSDEFQDRFVLLLIDDDLYANERGEEFYGWDLREANGSVVNPLSNANPESVIGRVYVMTLDPAPPFDHLERVAESDGVTLWESTRPDRPLVMEAD